MLAEDIDVAPDSLQSAGLVDGGRAAEAEEIVDDIDAGLDGGGGVPAKIGPFGKGEVYEVLSSGCAGVDTSVDRVAGIHCGADPGHRAAEPKLV